MNETLPLDNWRQRLDDFQKAFVDAYDRELEGRDTVWQAYVEKHEDAWWGFVLRVNVRATLGRRGPQRGWPCPREANGCWTIGPFSTAENAMAFTERWVRTRRDPGTWRGDQVPEAARRALFPVGDRLTLEISDEAAAVRWATTGDTGVFEEAATDAR